MENFIVSARKYRPATFDTVVGQPSITTTLKNAIRQNQLAQAFLFCGPRGVGKTTCARILAKTINCLNVTEKIEPCNTCESCKNFNTSASFNIYELDAASNNSVEDIRNLVDQVRIPPQAGKYKVYIIDEVHMLSAAAFNAFLKTLEEPPAYAKFILATTEKHKIIPTILSRCQIFDFKRITIESIVTHLKYVANSQQVTSDEDSLHIIAQKADGSMRDALSIFDQIVSFSGKEITYEKVIENLNVLDFDYYFRLTDSILEGNYASAILIIDDILDRGFDGQHFMGGFGSHMRNLLMCKDPSTVRLIDAGDIIRSRYLKQSQACQPSFLLKALEVNNQFDLNYRNANNKRLHLEILVLMLSGASTQAEPATVQKKKTIPEISEVNPVKATPAKPSIILDKAVEALHKPAVVPPPAQSVSLGKGSLSIKDLTAAPKPVKEENQATESSAAAKPASAFTTDDLIHAWNAYIELKGGESTNYYITLTRRKPFIGEGNVIILEVDNKLQEDELLTRKPEILSFLRNRLNNFLIEFTPKVIQAHKENKPYTPLDKFKKMAEINPAIIKLKDEFDLEIDF
jgi:DNA polymerase-3 subunit gamma/tau